MEDIQRYIEHYGHLSLAEKSLNEIDLLILTELIYLNMEDLVEETFTFNSQHTIFTFGEKFILQKETAIENNAYLINEERVKLIEAIYNTSRFRNIQLAGLYHELDTQKEVQFTSVTYRITDTQFLVVFRGTDDSIVGWKEDFKLMYLPEIPAQSLASKYLDTVFQKITGEIIVSGHSKGGNLAVYAASQLNDANFSRLKNVYAFDSPGFRQELTTTDAFTRTKEKVTAFIPEESIVGLLMYPIAQPIIVKSKQRAMGQHILLNWEIEEDHLIYIERISSLSQLIKETIDSWFKKRSPQQHEQFVENIFGLFDTANITSLNAFTDDFWGSIRKLYDAHSDPTLKEQLQTDWDSILSTAGTISSKYYKEYFKELENRIASTFPSLHHFFSELSQVFQSDDAADE